MHLQAFLLSALRSAKSGGHRYHLWMGTLTAIMLVGGYAYLEQANHGLVVTGMNNHVSWGLYISNMAFLVGVAAAAVILVLILPLLAPVTLSALIILGHMSLKVFDLIVAVAGKQLQLAVPAIYMWQVTFDGLFYGKGAAIGMLLLISVAFLIIPYLRYTLRTESES